MSLTKQFTIFGQAYGADAYGQEEYSCAANDVACQNPVQVVDASPAPNTGFFGTSDAALATTGGALLIAVAIVGAITVIVSRVKRTKKNEQ